jgi:hypothetical protein
MKYVTVASQRAAAFFHGPDAHTGPDYRDVYADMMAQVNPKDVMLDDEAKQIVEGLRRVKEILKNEY